MLRVEKKKSKRRVKEMYLLEREAVTKRWNENGEEMASVC